MYMLCHEEWNTGSTQHDSYMTILLTESCEIDQLTQLNDQIFKWIISVVSKMCKLATLQEKTLSSSL